MIGEQRPEKARRERTRKEQAAQAARSARKSRRRTQLEHRAQQRKQRARAHLDRVLDKTQPRSATRHPRHPSSLSAAVRRAIGAGAFAIALLAGTHYAKPILVNAGEWWSSERAVVERVAVQGHVRLNAWEVARSIESAHGQRLSRVETEALVRKLEEHPWIASARVTLLPDGSLIVRIDERRPVATLREASEAEAFLVDASGAVFARAEGEITECLFALQRSAPPIALTHGSDRLLARGARLAQTIAEREFSALAGASLALPEAGRNEGWVVGSADGALKVILGNEDDLEIESRLDRLATLLDAQADLWAGPPVGRIDLRFEERAILHASVEL